MVLLMSNAAWVLSVLNCLEPVAVIYPPMSQRHVWFSFCLIEISRYQDTHELSGYGNHELDYLRVKIHFKLEFILRWTVKELFIKIFPTFHLYMLIVQI